MRCWRGLWGSVNCFTFFTRRLEEDELRVGERGEDLCRTAESRKDLRKNLHEV